MGPIKPGVLVDPKDDKVRKDPDNQEIKVESVEMPGVEFDAQEMSKLMDFFSNLKQNNLKNLLNSGNKS